MEVFGTIVRFFQNGGLFMYPIVIILAIGLSIAIERYIYLTRSEAGNRKLWEKLQPLLSNGDYAGAFEVSSKSDAAVGQVLAYGISRMRTSSDRQDVEMSMEESLLEVTPQLEKRTHYLAVLANVATLLGLLGTIIGLIQGFTAVANVNPAEKADLLSASISVAMNTTAFGLMVAIPLLLLHAVLQTRTTALVDSIEMADASARSGRNEHHGIHEPDGHPRAVSADNRGVFATRGDATGPPRPGHGVDTRRERDRSPLSDRSDGCPPGCCQRGGASVVSYP